MTTTPQTRRILRCLTVPLAAWSLAAAPAIAHDFGDAYLYGTEADIPNTPVIVLDYSAAPDLAGYAYRAKARCETYYARIAHFLYSDGYTPPSRFLFVFRELDGVTVTTNTRVEFDATLIRKNPQDHGTAIHEMVRAIQRYPRLDPAWLVEGIADYVRFFMFEPASERPKPDPDRAHYSHGKGEAAAFLDWITRTQDKAFVPAVNAALREDRYTTSFWRERTRKDLDTLWAEYVAALRAERK